MLTCSTAAKWPVWLDHRKGWEARKPGPRSCRASQTTVRTEHSVLCVMGGRGGGVEGVGVDMI